MSDLMDVVLKQFLESEYLHCQCTTVTFLDFFVTKSLSSVVSFSPVDRVFEMLHYIYAKEQSSSQ